MLALSLSTNTEPQGAPEVLLELFNRNHVLLKYKAKIKLLRLLYTAARTSIYGIGLERHPQEAPEARRIAFMAILCGAVTGKEYLRPATG